MWPVASKRSLAPSTTGLPDVTELSLSIDGPIANLRLNRPEKANALDLALVEALHDGLDAATLAGSRLLILRGEGRNFCAGFDFTGFDTMPVADLCWRFVRIEQVISLFVTRLFPNYTTLGHGALSARRYLSCRSGRTGGPRLAG